MRSAGGHRDSSVGWAACTGYGRMTQAIGNSTTTRQIDGRFPTSAKFAQINPSLGLNVTMARYGDRFYALLAISSIDRSVDFSRSATRTDARVGCGYWYGCQGRAHRNGRIWRRRRWGERAVSLWPSTLRATHSFSTTASPMDRQSGRSLQTRCLTSRRCANRLRQSWSRWVRFVAN